MNTKPFYWLLWLCLTLVSLTSHAQIVSETLSYRDGETLLSGEIYYDSANKNKRPGILVVHEWWGLNDYVKQRAKMLAKLGYIAFAVDMYGKGKVTQHAKDAKTWMTQITSNVEAWQKRAQLGLAMLKKHKLTQTDQIAAIGYCFGGNTVMQLAYSGADISGVVSFHGSLPVASPDQAKAIVSPVMIAHGYADSFIPKDRVAAFKQALDEAGVDWQFHTYSAAKHGFTNPNAGQYQMDALAYNKNADLRSWQQMQAFFNAIFNKPQ